MISPRQRLKLGAAIYNIDAVIPTMRQPDIGKMRDLVEVQTPTDVDQSDGGVAQTWLTTECVYAHVEALKGREYIEAAGMQAQVTHRIRVHARPPHTVLEIMARETVE
jgi:head-tail adaptor